MFYTLRQVFSEKISLLNTFLQVVLGSCVLALCSQISIPLSFTPVPLSLQTLAVMGIGAFLGSKKGFLAVLLYLIEGSVGLPVFAGGSFGLLKLLGPSGGYLMGFLLQAYLVGLYTERTRNKTFSKTYVTLFLISLLQMGLGVLWLSLSTGFTTALTLGFFPFLVGDLLKVGAVTTLTTQRET